MKILLRLILWICGFISSPVFAQIQYTADFTQKLNLCGIEIDHPEEGWYKAIPRPDNDENLYDLLLRSEVDEMEIRYYLIPAHLDNHIIPPQISFTTFLSNLATNDDQNYLIVRKLPPVDAREKYSAEWAGVASFIPRESVSDKEKGKLLCIYHSDKARAYVIIFYNQNYQLAEKRLQSVRFGNKT